MPVMGSYWNAGRRGSPGQIQWQPRIDDHPDANYVQPWGTPIRLEGTADLGAPSLRVIAFEVPMWAAPQARLLWRHDAELDGVAAPPQESTWQPFLVRVPFKALGRNPYLRNTAQDFSFVAPEADTLAQFLVRLPFKGLGRNPYLRATAQDFSVVEPFDLPHFQVRLPLRGLGRNPYNFNPAGDIQVAVVEAETLGQFLVRVPLRGLGRNPYLWNTAQDFSFVADEADTLSQFLVRLPYKTFGKNPYLVRSIQDFDAPVITPEESTWQPYLVRLNIRGVSWVVPGLIFSNTTQDEDAPPIVIPTGGTFIPTFRTRRGR